MQRKISQKRTSTNNCKELGKCEKYTNAERDDISKGLPNFLAHKSLYSLRIILLPFQTDH